MMTQASQPSRALAALLTGANTAADVAIDLGITIERAGHVLRRLRRRGHVRRTERRIPSSTGRGGNQMVVWEAQ